MLSNNEVSNANNDLNNNSESPVLLVNSSNSDRILRFDSTTGEFLDVFNSGEGGLDIPTYSTIGPDGNLYVSGRENDGILRYDGETGEFIDVFTSDGSLDFPTGVTFGPDNNLYVSSGFTSEVLRYDGETGEFIDAFASGEELTNPAGITFGADGNFYVSNSNFFDENVTGTEVLRYDGETGEFIDVFASGGGLNTPGGVTFGPDGNLYVSSFGTSEVLRYDGETGEFIDVFTSGGDLNGPTVLTFGPDNNLYVSGRENDGVLRYDGETGEFIDVFASGSGLDFPVGLSFTSTPIPEASDGNESAPNLENSQLQETVSQMLQTLEAGDKQGFLEQQTTDVIWEVDGEQIPLGQQEFLDPNINPLAGTWFGSQGLSQTVGDFFDITQESLDIDDLEILDLFQKDNSVLARVNIEARVGETELPVDIDFNIIAELSDSGDEQGKIESVRVIYSTYPLAEAFSGQSPSSAAVDLNQRDPLKGENLSVDSNAQSEETLQVVQEAYNNLVQFDPAGIQGFSELFAEDATLVYTGDPSVLPVAQVVEGGPEAISQYFIEGAQVFAPRVLNPREIFVDGDRAAVVVDVGFTDTTNNISIDYTTVAYLTVEDGLITNWQLVSDSYAVSSALAGEPFFVDELATEPVPTEEVTTETTPTEEPDPVAEPSIGNEILSLNDIFDESYYLENNPEAAAAVAEGDFASGLEHFQAIGIEEGLRFSPFIDLNYYKDIANPDLVDFSNREALDHLLEEGIEQDRVFSPFVDLEFYQEANPDLANLSNSEALLHLGDTGLDAGLKFSSFVDLEEYRAFSPELAEFSLSETFSHLATEYAPEDEGRIRFPLEIGFNIPDELSVFTPEVVTGSGEAAITYSKEANEVVIDLDLEGLPYRETFTRPEDVSTPYNQQLTSVEDSKWQLWLNGKWFNFESNYWYDGQTGQLIGNEHDLPGGVPETDSPIDVNDDGIVDTPVALPTTQSIGSPIFEGNPDGTANIRLEYTYDELLDELGTAGVFSTVLPYNLNSPDEVGVYYTEGGLPTSLAMNWDEVLSSIRNNERVQIAISAEPDPKPDFLDARPNTMDAWAGFYPLSTPEGLVYEPTTDSYRPIEPSDLEVHANEPFPARLAEITRETESVFGGLEPDNFDATNPSDEFDGNRDTLFTGAGDDFADASQAFGATFPGTVGHNRIYGGEGNDELFAGTGDRLFAGNGNDLLDASAGFGNNRLYGGKGNDELFAGTGDRLFAGAGDDLLDATTGSGNNRLYGQDGLDTLFLGTGDRLVGGDGNDAFFVTNGGDNLITGGDGADAFWIATGEIVTTANTITDFEIDTDVIGVAGIGATSTDDLEFTQMGNEAVISFSDFDLARLSHTQIGDLQSSDAFVFA